MAKSNPLAERQFIAHWLAVQAARVRFLPSTKQRAELIRWIFRPLGLRWLVSEMEPDTIICPT